MIGGGAGFGLTPELEQLRDTVRRLAREKVQPRSREVDLTGEYPSDWFDSFKSAGLLGLAIPEEFGGSGAGILALAIAVEEVAKYSSTAALMLLLTRLATTPVLIGGGEDQKKRYVAAIADGSQRAAFGLSEPGAGSDVAGMSTRAVPDMDRPGGYILTGQKCWISGVSQADWFAVFARTGEGISRSSRDIRGFIVERGFDGVGLGRVDRKMGVHGIDTGELNLDGVRVPPENAIGAESGFSVAMRTLNTLRPVVAARGLGLAEGALEYAVEYAKGREMFGVMESEMQGLQWEIAKCAVDIEAARLLTYRAASYVDEGKVTRQWAPYLSMAKYYATELAVRTSSLALQLLGAAGYMEEQPTEQWYRDAKQLTIVEGTSQVQLGIVARGVLDGDVWWD